jgi:predicted aspartyl protease
VFHTFVSPSLEALGPVVTVDISVSSIVRATVKKVAPVPVRVQALIDTGANGTVFVPAVFQRLGIHPHDATEIRTPGQLEPQQVPIFNVDLSIFDSSMVTPVAVLANSRVIEASLRGQPVEGLIGRDLLRHFIFEYHGPQSFFRLTRSRVA